MIDVPVAVRNLAGSVGATVWLHELPDLIADLERSWSIDVGPAFPDATEAFVAEATRADGSPAVMKLVVPRAGEAARNEITVLRLADGRGCAELLAHDVDRGALLIERLGPSLFELGFPMGRRQEILCTAAEQVWRPAPEWGLPSGADKGRWLVEAIATRWEELDRPCTERAVAHAFTCADRRIAAHDLERSVLVHGDVHQWNALVAGDGFKLVDPDGLVAEAEYDLGIIMREDPVELMGDDPRQRARWLATRTGLDADAIWEWGVVERVCDGLLLTEIELEPVAREMLAAADHVAAVAGA